LDIALYKNLPLIEN